MSSSQKYPRGDGFSYTFLSRNTEVYTPFYILSSVLVFDKRKFMKVASEGTVGRIIRKSVRRRFDVHTVNTATLPEVRRHWCFKSRAVENRWKSIRGATEGITQYHRAAKFQSSFFFLKTRRQRLNMKILIEVSYRSEWKFFLQKCPLWSIQTQISFQWWDRYFDQRTYHTLQRHPWAGYNCKFCRVNK